MKTNRHYFPDCPDCLQEQEQEKQKTADDNNSDSDYNNHDREWSELQPNYQDSVTPPTTEEYNSMKQSIESEGQYNPITVNKDLVILDWTQQIQNMSGIKFNPKIRN